MVITLIVSFNLSLRLIQTKIFFGIIKYNIFVENNNLFHLYDRKKTAEQILGESNLEKSSFVSKPGDIILIDPFVLHRSVVDNSYFFLPFIILSLFYIFFSLFIYM